jgi:hypothetical protein
MAQHHNVTRMANMPICTHLSNQIKLNQFFFGNDEPGNVNRITERIKKAMAGKKEGLILFNKKFLFCIYLAALKNIEFKYL